jgi:DNA-binding MarR family transcriptional regulator
VANDTRREKIEALLEAGRSVGTASVMFHGAVAERLGLGASEHKALDLLRRYGEMTAGELTEHTGLTSGAITGIIDRLERAGLAERVRSAEDRRKVIVRPILTRDSELSRIFGELQRAHEALFERYTDEELALLVDFMSRTAELMREQTAKLSAEPAGGGRRRKT